MEMLLIKALGYLVIVQIPAWLILQLLPESWQRIALTRIWDDPAQ